MPYGRSVHHALVAALLTAVATSVAAQIPPISISASKEEVEDEFVAYLHGLFYHDAELWIDGDSLLREFPEFIPDHPSPIYDIVQFSRTKSGRLTIGFSVPLRHEVPVDIFGLHPVELQSSRVITFDESIRPSPAGISDGLPRGIDLPSDATDLLVLVLSSGYMRVDFAPWLDFVAGRLLDDVDIVLVAVVRYRGEWLALMGGYNPDGRSMAWVFDMGSSRFLVSPPRSLTQFARALVESHSSSDPNRFPAR